MCSDSPPGGRSTLLAEKCVKNFYIFFRWLFFIEGMITILVAFWSMSILPDFPENSSSWLSPSEKAVALERMAEDAGPEEGRTFRDAIESKERLGRWPGLQLAIKDWKVWWLSATLTCMVICLSFNAYFPTLSATMGYGPRVTLLLCVPPWLFATGIALALSRLVCRKESP
jgi:hypothetical protein